MASFPEIVQMESVCDRSHKHHGWGFTTNAAGQKVWATSEESQYPRKLCIALVQLVLQVAAQQGVILKPECFNEFSDHPLQSAKQSRVATGQQPRGAKLPPVVPDFQQSATFLAKSPFDVPCGLLQKLPRDVSLRTELQQPVIVPKGARLLRGLFVGDSSNGDEQMPQQNNSNGDEQMPQLGPQQNKRKLEQSTGEDEIWRYKVVFGLPWDCQQFVQKACEVGHPAAKNHAVPKDLRLAIDKHVQWPESTLAEYRMQWCRKWLKRAKELESDERNDALKRPEHVRRATEGKRILLTEEILKSIDYEDMEVLELLRDGSPLAGDIPSSAVFEECYKPCLLTLPQLVRESDKQNQAILASCKTSGDRAVDEQILAETKEEVRLGWARGPFDSVPEGCVVSRRFGLVQGSKTRMIDDYSISGINDTASTSNKVDLHMVDTFAAMMRQFYQQCEEAGLGSELMARTYDLKSAYRQVPIREDHLQFSFFSIFNVEKGCAETYQLLTLPFGATHSVYSFLRLSRSLYSIATRALFLLITNFYDDFIFGSLSDSLDSARNAMEMVFLLTGWQYATDGKKCTSFDRVCKALGVEFDLSKSGERTLTIRNTAQRVEDLQMMIEPTNS